MTTPLNIVINCTSICCYISRKNAHFFSKVSRLVYLAFAASSIGLISFMALFTLEELFAYVTETYTAGVIESTQGQRDALTLSFPLPYLRLPRRLRSFRNTIHPRETTAKWAGKDLDRQNGGCRLWKTMKCVFCIQILGGLVTGSLALVIIVLDFNSSDLCYDAGHSQNWTSLPRKIQAVIQPRPQVLLSRLLRYLQPIWSSGFQSFTSWFITSFHCNSRQNEINKVAMLVY